MADPKDFTSTEFAVGSVFGLRSWRLLSQGKYLESPVKHKVWYPDLDVYQADCNAYGNFHLWQEIPKPNCECGFYFYRPEYFIPCGNVMGLVEGFGKTIIGSKGYRCEKLRIKALAYFPYETTYDSGFKSFMLHQYKVPVYKHPEPLIAAHKEELEIEDLDKFYKKRLENEQRAEFSIRQHVSNPTTYVTYPIVRKPRPLGFNA